MKTLGNSIRRFYKPVRSVTFSVYKYMMFVLLPLLMIIALHPPDGVFLQRRTSGPQGQLLVAHLRSLSASTRL